MIHPWDNSSSWDPVPVVPHPQHTLSPWCPIPKPPCPRGAPSPSHPVPVPPCPHDAPSPVCPTTTPLCPHLVLTTVHPHAPCPRDTAPRPSPPVGAGSGLLAGARWRRGGPRALLPSTCCYFYSLCGRIRCCAELQPPRHRGTGTGTGTGTARGRGRARHGVPTVLSRRRAGPCVPHVCLEGAPVRSEPPVPRCRCHPRVTVRGRGRGRCVPIPGGCGCRRCRSARRGGGPATPSHGVFVGGRSGNSSGMEPGNLLP